MVLIEQQEVIYSEFDLETRTKTIYYHRIEKEIDVIPLVMELWLKEHQKECCEGLAQDVLSGI